MTGQDFLTQQGSSSNTCSSTFEGTVYYLQRSILLLAADLVIGPQDKTHGRRSCRIIVAYQNPFRVEFCDQAAITTQAIVLDANSGISNLVGHGSDIALLDFTPATEGYDCTKKFLQEQRYKEFDPELLSDFRAEFIAGQQGSIKPTRVEQLLSLGVERVTGEKPETKPIDSRVFNALQIINTLPLNQINLELLASSCHLSKDRFRHLFKESMECSVMQYARQTAVWRTLKKMDAGMPMVEAALLVGFHDVSHFYHAYSDLFGVSVSERNNPRRFRRVRCFN